LSASFDKSTNKVRVTIANFQEYSSIMLMNGSNNGTNVGSAVLKCYIVETHSNSSPNCLLATKLSWDYNQATFELSLTDYAIQEWVNKNKMSVYVDNWSISWYNYHSNIIDILPVSWSSTISATIQPQSRTSVSNFLPNVKITTTWLTSCSWCGMSVPCNGTIDMYWSQPQDVGTTHSDTCSFTATKTNGGSVSVDSTSTCTRGALWQPWKCYYPWLNKTW
jgi:hypothetical protein